jgi:hypothetical protein
MEEATHQKETKSGYHNTREYSDYKIIPEQGG